MKSPILKRSVIINDHKTSVSLEQPFWLELKAIAAERKVGLGDLIATVDADKKQPNLSSALRVFVLAKYYRPDDVSKKAVRRGTARAALSRHPA
jgi:predicted DNA-binding ribbon-helix-helix protein